MLNKNYIQWKSKCIIDIILIFRILVGNRTLKNGHVFCLFCICWSQNNPLVSSSVVTKAAWYCSWVHQVKALSILWLWEQKICFYLFTQKVVSNKLGSIWWIPYRKLKINLIFCCWVLGRRCTYNRDLS